MTEAQEKTLIAYVKEVARQHNELEARVARLERDSMPGEEAANLEGRDE